LGHNKEREFQKICKIRKKYVLFLIIFKGINDINIDESIKVGNNLVELIYILIEHRNHASHQRTQF
jgi:hypothetical protein